MNEPTNLTTHGLDLNVRQICRPDDFRGASVSIETVLPSGRRMSVEAYGPEKRYGGQELTEARVNWPGIGASDVADTAAFASLLAAAAEIAAALAGPVV